MSVLISASAGDLPFHAAPRGGAYPGDLMNTTGTPVKKTWGMQVRLQSDHMDSSSYVLHNRKRTRRRSLDGFSISTSTP
jgi:hypothetical protein